MSSRRHTIALVAATLAQNRAWTTRVVVAGLVALMPLQFTGFWNDYFTSYRERESFWLCRETAQSTVLSETHPERASRAALRRPSS